MVTARENQDRIRRDLADVLRSIDECGRMMRDAVAESTDDAAERLVRGEDVGDPPVVADLERYRRRRELLRAAERKATQEIREAELEAVSEISESLIPRYRELQERIAPLVAQLSELAEAEFRLHRAMMDAGLPFEGGKLAVNGLHQMRLSQRTLAREWAETAREAYGVRIPG